MFDPTKVARFEIGYFGPEHEQNTMMKLCLDGDFVQYESYDKLLELYREQTATLESMKTDLSNWQDAAQYP